MSKPTQSARALRTANMPGPLFFSCTVRRDLLDVVPSENQLAIGSSTLSDFSTDYLRSELADHLDYREDDPASLLERVEGRKEVLLEFSIVMPQCSECRSKGVQPKSQRPVQNKTANVVSERRRIAQAEAEAQARADQHQPAPERNDAGHDRVHQIVGARTTSDGDVDLLVHWEKLNGEVYPESQCTWEPANDIVNNQLDFDFLHSKPVEVSTKKRKNTGEFVECRAETKRCKVTYNNRKADQWLIVSKPTKEHSWQLSGYGLFGDESSNESEESAQSSHESEE